MFRAAVHLRAVVFNLGYAYPRGYEETFEGVRTITKNIPVYIIL
jgi:hypothetical protein